MRFCNISVCYWLCSTAFVIEDCNIISTIEILNWKKCQLSYFCFLYSSWTFGYSEQLLDPHDINLRLTVVIMVVFWLHVEGDLKLISTYAHIGLDNSQACLENSCPFVCVHHEKVSMKKLNAGFLCGLTVTLSLIT